MSGLGRRHTSSASCYQGLPGWTILFIALLLSPTGLCFWVTEGSFHYPVALLDTVSRLAPDTWGRNHTCWILNPCECSCTKSPSPQQGRGQRLELMVRAPRHWNDLSNHCNHWSLPTWEAKHPEILLSFVYLVQMSVSHSLWAWWSSLH